MGRCVTHLEEAKRSADRRSCAALALPHDVLLLWGTQPRPSATLVLRVRLPPLLLTIRLTADLYRMRYSRLLEENSFSNRRADFVWLLCLVAGFLLVRHHDGPYALC